ncbi:28879_t:CDS:2, partial [Dentiscutata erythropus]
TLMKINTLELVILVLVSTYISNVLTQIVISIPIIVQLTTTSTIITPISTTIQTTVTLFKPLETPIIATPDPNNSANNNNSLLTIIEILGTTLTILTTIVTILIFLSRPTEQQATPFTRPPARTLNQEQVQSLANNIRDNQRNNRQFQGIGTRLSQQPQLTRRIRQGKFKRDTENQPYYLYQTVDGILEELEELKKKQNQTEKQETEYKYIELSKEEE